MNEKKEIRKYYKKYLYYRFLLALKEYDKKWSLKAEKVVNIHISMDFMFPEEMVEFLKKEITQTGPERH